MNSLLKLKQILKLSFDSRLRCGKNKYLILTYLTVCKNKVMINYKIFIVDDDVIQLKLLQYLLQSKGYRCLAYSDPVEAYSQVFPERPDLILLDYVMPVLNGIEFCRNLKQKAIFKDLPVIFITSLKNDEELVEAFDAGAIDYITKT